MQWAVWAALPSTYAARVHLITLWEAWQGSSYDWIWGVRRHMPLPINWIWSVSRSHWEEARPVLQSTVDCVLPDGDDVPTDYTGWIL
jgi:hypothetical protein